MPTPSGRKLPNLLMVSTSLRRQAMAQSVSTRYSMGRSLKPGHRPGADLPADPNVTLQLLPVNRVPPGSRHGP